MVSPACTDLWKLSFLVCGSGSKLAIVVLSRRAKGAVCLKITIATGTIKLSRNFCGKGRCPKLRSQGLSCVATSKHGTHKYTSNNNKQKLSEFYCLGGMFRRNCFYCLGFVGLGEFIHYTYIALPFSLKSPRETEVNQGYNSFSYYLFHFLARPL